MIQIMTSMIVIMIVLLTIAWLLYPAIIFVAAKVYSLFYKKPAVTIHNLTYPDITIVVPIHNGGSHLQAKIDNIFSQQYEGRIKLIIISDGSTDNTDIIANDNVSSNTSFIKLNTRNGKSYVQNIALKQVNTEYVLFTDVSARMETGVIKKLAETLRNDNIVGCAGARIIFNKTDLISRAYWWFENKLRISESHLGILATLSGAALMFKTQYFDSLDPDTGDDFVLPLNMKLNHGMKSILVEDAFVSDHDYRNDAFSILNARRRITSRSMLAILRRLRLLNPIIYPGTSLMLFSHKIIRWFTPVIILLIVLLIIIQIPLFWSLLLIIGVSVITFMSCKLDIKRFRVLWAIKRAWLENFGILLGIYDCSIGKKINYY